MKQCQNSACQGWFEPKHNTKGMYCSRSCAAQVNNQKYPRRKRSSDTICRCGGFKQTKSKRCDKCRKKDDYHVMMNKPIRNYFCSHPDSKSRYNDIRRAARRIMQKYGPKKECKICGFDIIVEVCHINSIAKFPETALMKEVNALDNLVYLCPNHHAMFDRGLVEV